MPSVVSALSHVGFVDRALAYPPRPRTERSLRASATPGRIYRALVSFLRSRRVDRALAASQRPRPSVARPAEPDSTPPGAKIRPPATMSAESIELIRKLSLDLQHRAAEIETIFEMLPIGISIADDPGCDRIRFNRAFAELVGQPDSTFTTVRHPGVENALFKVSKDGRPLPPRERPMRVAAAESRHVNGVVLDVIRPDGRRVTLIENAAPLFDVDGHVRGAIGIFLDITERRRTEQEQRFLAEASGVLSSSLDYETTLRQLAHLSVPMLGDYCAVDVIRDNGSFARIDFVVTDPVRAPLADVLRRYPPVLTVDSPAARALRSGEPMIVDEVSNDLLERSAQTPEHLDVLRQLEPRSFMMVPLRVRGRSLGLLTTGSLNRRLTGRAIWHSHRTWRPAPRSHSTTRSCTSMRRRPIA